MEDKKRALEDEDSTPPDYVLRCEALINEKKKEIQVHFHAHRADDIFTAIRLAKEFGLDYDAAFAGCAGDTEPSARVIASLIEEIQSENIKAIYHVEMGNTKTAQMIQEATGVEILELHSCHTVTSKQLQEGVTYVELMRQNAENLKKGLQ